MTDHTDLESEVTATNPDDPEAPTEKEAPCEPPWWDLMHARRRQLRQSGPSCGPSYLPASVQRAVAADPYHYTKQPEIVNAELGYGETVKEVLSCPNSGGRLEPTEYVSQRTVTGKRRREPESGGGTA
jgi:hypothetical protein